MTAAHAPFLKNLVAFVDMLRRAGIPVSTEQTMETARALELIELGDRQQVFYAIRGLMVRRREELRLFEILFNRFWRDHDGASWPDTARPSRRPPAQNRSFTVATYLDQKAELIGPDTEAGERGGTYSDQEVLQHKSFAEMSADELTEVRRLIRSLQWQVSLRPTRRRVTSRRGAMLHIRRTLRDAARQGGIPVQLAWSRRKVKQRPLVVIADISGSMEKYARLLLQLSYGLVHGAGPVECFVFGTRLTRITPQLRRRNMDRALAEAARDVVDWSGGTRIGASLHRFNQVWARRVLRRGAVVLIVSDGWERGDVATLRRAMRFLRDRCHRLIWLNPLLGQAGYQPLVEGMVAALPFIDDFLPVHNLHSLNDLARHLARLSGRRSARAGPGIGPASRHSPPAGAPPPRAWVPPELS